MLFMKKISVFLLCLAFCACHENLMERAEREASEFTRRNCPQQLANGLVCDSLVFEPADSTLHHHYTLSGAADDADIIKGNAKMLHDALLQDIRNDVNMRTYKEAGFNYAVTIRSAKHPGKTLYQTRFTRMDYEGKAK